MPIPVGGPGNVDGEGGTENGTVHPGPLADPWWMADVQEFNRLRVWLEPIGIQPDWSVRWPGPTRVVVVDSSGRVVFAAPLGAAPSMAELSDDAHDHGADDER